MATKILFILKHESPQDDLEYVKKVALKKDVQVKLLLLNGCYIFDKPDYSYDSDWKLVTIKTHLDEILKNGEVAMDETLNLYTRSEYDPEYSKEYGRFMRLREVNIIRVNPSDYVAEAVAEGFQLVKW